MRVIQLGLAPRAIADFGSRGAFLTPMADFQDCHMVRLQLDAGGHLGRHEAAGPQVMVVLRGEGEVSGQKRNAVAVRPGAVVVWESGEKHETRTQSGMDVLIVEGWKPTPSTRPTTDDISPD